MQEHEHEVNFVSMYRVKDELTSVLEVHFRHPTLEEHVGRDGRQVRRFQEVGGWVEKQWSNKESRQSLWGKCEFWSHLPEDEVISLKR